MRLRDCARSTSLGMLDRWPGKTMERLATQNMIVWSGDQKSGGWKATTAGLAELKTPENLVRLEVL